MRPDVMQLLALLLDEGSMVRWDGALVPSPHMTDSYAAELEAARAKTGRDEGFLTGEGTVHGRRVAFIAGDPAFLGGSLGVAGAERLTQGIERATREELPLIALPVGGGTRMQEGAIAFIQMVTITQAVTAHKAAHLPYLVYMRHPTMGGVFASWGSLGHLTLAEPGSMLGFLGPRVYEALYGQEFPKGVQLAENLHAHGIVDAVVAPDELAATVDRVLTVMLARREHGLTPGALPRPVEAPQPEVPDVDAWESITLTRRPDRPGVRDLLAVGATDVTMLNGTGDGESHPGSLLALARFGGMPCVVVGQCRVGQTIDKPLDAAALREARRGLKLSRELRLPLVTLIDTPGAALSKEAEERGLGGEIARTLSELVTLPTPTVSLLFGQGAGGIALALVPADRVIASQHSWLAPLPPEGAAAIVHRDTARAPEIAVAQGVRARDLLASGIVDRVVLEEVDAATDPEAFCRTLADAVRDALRASMAQNRRHRLDARREKYRNLGL